MQLASAEAAEGALGLDGVEFMGRALKERSQHHSNVGIHHGIPLVFISRLWQSACSSPNHPALTHVSVHCMTDVSTTALFRPKCPVCVQVLPKLRKPPARSVPHWLFRSMSSLMPYMWGSARHGNMLGAHTSFPGQGGVGRHSHRRFVPHYAGSGRVPASAWIRGISDPLQIDRDR